MNLGYFETQDGTRLAYVLWLPSDHGVFPAVLTYSAYSNGGFRREDAQRFLDAGYAFVAANVRGTGASEGAFSYYQPAEGLDGAELVEWIARQTWCDGRVGMVGASYGGHTQVKVAAQRPPHLRAIVPMATEGSEYRDEGVTGGVFNAGLLGVWTFEIQPQLARNGVEARRAMGDEECTAIVEAQPPNRSYQEVLEHPLYDAWWDERSLDTMAAHVEVPTLLVHGWQDEWIRPNGAARLFDLLGSAHKRIVFENGAHGLGALTVNQEEELRWLDRWVKEEANGVEDEAPVHVLWEVQASDGDRTTGRPAWRTSYASWPPSQLEQVTLHLTADSRLAAEPGACGVRTYLAPLATELVGSAEQSFQHSGIRSLEFT